MILKGGDLITSCSCLTVFPFVFIFPPRDFAAGICNKLAEMIQGKSLDFSFLCKD